MEKKKIVPVWVSVIFAALCACIIGMQGYFFVQLLSANGDSPANLIVYAALKLLDILLAVYALVYCFSGYRKKAAAYFAAFCIIYAVYAGLAIYLLGLMGANFIHFVSLLLTFGVMFVFSTSADLGKTRSCGLALTVLVCAAVNVIIRFTSCASSFQTDLSYRLPSIGDVVLALVFCTMVYAKYQDKAARGSR